MWESQLDAENDVIWSEEVKSFENNEKQQKIWILLRIPAAVFKAAVDISSGCDGGLWHTITVFHTTVNYSVGAQPACPCGTHMG